MNEGNTLYREMLKSKIHRATVRQARLHHVGSITVDAPLVAAADLWPGEKADVAAIDNGARIGTYVMAGEPDSGMIDINGAAARLVNPGDSAIIISYAAMSEERARSYEPSIVFVDAGNRPVRIGCDPAEVSGGFGLVPGDTVQRLIDPVPLPGDRR